MVISGIRLARQVSLDIESLVSGIGVNPRSESMDTQSSAQINNFNKLGKIVRFQSAVQNSRNFICKHYNHTVAEFNKSIITGFNFDFINQRLGITFINLPNKIGHLIYTKFTGEVHGDQGDGQNLEYELTPSDTAGLVI